MTTPHPPLAETEKLAAQMLAQPNPVAQLSLAEAMVVVDMMRPKRIAAGTVFISEGEAKHIDYMALVLAGDVAVETRKPGTNETRLINIVSAGTILGDMSLVDGMPRLTTCRAQTRFIRRHLDPQSPARAAHHAPCYCGQTAANATPARITNRTRDFEQVQQNRTNECRLAPAIRRCYERPRL